MPQYDRRQPSHETLSGPRTDRGAALSERQITGQQLLNRGKLDLEDGSFSIKLNKTRGDSSSNEYEYKIGFNRDGSLEMRVNGVYSGIGVLQPFKYSESKSFAVNKRDGTDDMAPSAVDYLAKLVQKNTPWVSKDEINALCDEVFLRLSPINAQRSFRDKGERFILDKDADRDKMNDPKASMATTVAQQFNRTFGELGCYSFVRSMSLVFLKDTPLFSGAFIDSKKLEVKEIFAKLRGQTPSNGKTITFGTFEGQFRFFTPHIRELDGETKRTMENLAPGSVVFMQQDGRRDPRLAIQREVSHIGIVVQGRSSGGILGIGGHNPVVAHVIGGKILFDEIREQDCETNRWMGVGNKWSIAGFLRPNPESVLLPRGIDSLKGEIADVTFAKYAQGTGYEADISVRDAAAWLKKNSPVLKNYSEIGIQNTIATLNADRVFVDPNDARQFRIIGHRPLHIPRDWLPSSVKLGKGIEYPRAVVNL